MKPEQLKAYMEKLLAEAPLTAEDRDRLLAAVADEKVAKNADNVFVPRETFNSELDKQKAGYEQKLTQYHQWYETESAKLERWKAENGNPANARQMQGNPNLVMTEGGNVITREELEEIRSEMAKALETQGANFVGLTEVMMTLADDYRARFGERLPIEKVRELAVEKTLPLAVAYEQYIAPKVKEQSDAEWQKKLEEAREEGRREGATRATNPAAGSRFEDHPMFAKRDFGGQDPSKLTPEQKEALSYDQFEKEYNKTNGFTKTN